MYDHYTTQYQRLMFASNARSHHELSVFLGGVRHAELSDAARRGCIPKAWLPIAQGKGVNPDWILTGTGDMTVERAESACPPPPGAVDSCPAQQLARDLTHVLENCPFQRQTLPLKPESSQGRSVFSKN